MNEQDYLDLARAVDRKFVYVHDTYTIQHYDKVTDKNNYYPEDKTLTLDEIVNGLQYKKTLGTRLTKPQTNKSKAGLLDIDKATDAPAIVRGIDKYLKETHCIETYPEASGGDNRFHNWIIFKTPVDNEKLLALNTEVFNFVKETFNEEIEYFPNTAKPNQFGANVKLPLQMNQRWGKPSQLLYTNLTPVPDEKIIDFVISIIENDPRNIDNWVIPENRKYRHDVTTTLNDNMPTVTAPPPENKITYPLRYCLQRLIDDKIGLHGKEGHYARLCIARELIYIGRSDEEIKKFFSTQSDYNPKETEDKIKELRQGNYKPWKTSVMVNYFGILIRPYCASCTQIGCPEKKGVTNGC